MKPTQYWLVRDPDQDEPYLVDNKDTLDLHLSNGFILEETLYTDALRVAAKEALQLLEELESEYEFDGIIETLRNLTNNFVR